MNTAALDQTLGARSRIDGPLHRILPAEIVIRADEPSADDAPDGQQAPLLRLSISASSEIPYLRQSWWDDPWIEVLGHKATECDLSRFTGGAGVVLANHDRSTAVGDTPLAAIGAVDAAKLSGGRLLLDITLSRREALADLRQDIADGLVRNVSIGYQINERVLVRQGKDGEADEYRVTSWTPFEVSLVDIPADAGVGIGRSAEAGPTPESAPRYRVVELPPATGPNQKERSMPELAPAADPTTATDPLAAERQRARDILALGRQFDATDIADQAIDAGTPLDAFRAQLLERVRNVQRTSPLRPAESPEIGMSGNDVERYSLARALLAAMDPHHAAKIAPFEMECSRAAQDKRGDSRDKTREAAITVPVDVLSRGIVADAAAGSAAMRALMARAQGGGEHLRTLLSMQRDLLAGTPTAGGNTVATEMLGSSFIDLLRNSMILDRLGITWMRDLNGNIAIPSQTGAAQYYWVAENGAPTESQQTTGQVTMTPKTVGAFTDYSRRLLLQSSIDVEMFVRADLAAIIAQAIQYAALNGSGAANEPTGILNLSGIGSVALGTNGAAPTYDAMVDLETALDNANADAGNMAYVTNSKVRGKLRKTQEFLGTNGRAVWQPGRESGIGDVLGYDAWVTNTVPSNLTKGAASGVCSAILFGNWSRLMVGLWGGLDLMLDPYANSTTGGKRVIALQDLDIAAREATSFSAIKDALTT